MSTELSFTTDVPMKKMKGMSFFQQKKIYAISDFDLSLLQSKLHLPMVSLPWTASVLNSTISDLSGGYLSAPTGDIYHRYRLLTSNDLSHFYIKLEPSYEHICMNTLQSQAFEINKEGFTFILNHRDRLVEMGLLIMPSFLESKGSIRPTQDVFLPG